MSYSRENRMRKEQRGPPKKCQHVRGKKEEEDMRKNKEEQLEVRRRIHFKYYHEYFLNSKSGVETIDLKELLRRIKG